MQIFQLWGGPGAGKTTLSYYLAYRLKKAGLRTELVGEAARESHIYQHTPDQVPAPLLDNQILVTGQQYERMLRLQRHNFEVAVSDSPLEMGLMYCEGHTYYNNLKAVIGDLSKTFDTYNIFVNPRPGSYDPESRVQKTEAEARAFDKKARELGAPFWMEIGWGEEEKLASAVVLLAMSKNIYKPANIVKETVPVTVTNVTTSKGFDVSEY